MSLPNAHSAVFRIRPSLQLAFLPPSEVSGEQPLLLADDVDRQAGAPAPSLAVGQHLVELVQRGQVLEEGIYVAEVMVSEKAESVYVCQRRTREEHLEEEVLVGGQQTGP